LSLIILRVLEKILHQETGNMWFFSLLVLRNAQPEQILKVRAGWPILFVEDG